MFTITLKEAPDSYKKLVEEFKSSVEVSKDGKTVTLGDQSAHLVRRLSYAFYMSARWEVPMTIDGVSNKYICLMPAKNIDTVKSMLATQAASKVYSMSDLAHELKSTKEESIVKFKCGSIGS